MGHWLVALRIQSSPGLDDGDVVVTSFGPDGKENTADDIRARLLVDQPTVLLVDPSDEDTELVEARLKGEALSAKDQKAYETLTADGGSA